MSRTAVVKERKTAAPVVLGRPFVLFCGAPGRIRTPDQELRRLLLYPPELRARKVLHFARPVINRPGKVVKAGTSQALR